MQPRKWWIPGRPRLWCEMPLGAPPWRPGTRSKGGSPAGASSASAPTTKLPSAGIQFAASSAGDPATSPAPAQPVTGNPSRAHSVPDSPFPPESIHSRIAFPPLRHPSTANPPPTSSTSPPPAKAAMMAYAPSQATHRSALSHVAILDTENMTREEDRLLSHAAVPSAPQDVYCLSTPEVAYALSHQLHVHRHNIMVTRHKPGVFMVEFRLAPQCHTGMEDMEPMDRGRPISRSPTRGWRGERLPSPRY